MTTRPALSNGNYCSHARHNRAPRGSHALQCRWRCIGVTLFAVGAVWQFSGHAALAEADTAAADAKRYDDEIRPVLARHCLECHGIEKPKGDLRLDQLAPNFDNEAIRAQWSTVLERIKAGEMPPKEKPRLDEKDVRSLTEWIAAEVDAAIVARRAKTGRVVLRRLNRIEYEKTVRDLLGVEVELKEMLPLDTSASGFDNIGDALHTSSFLLERYLEAADAALGVAIANQPKPISTTKRYSCKDEFQVKTTDERVFRHLDEAVVLFSSSPWQAITLWQFYPSQRGKYRFRISAYGFQSAGKPVTFGVDAGSMLMGGKNHLAGYYDAPADKPTVVEINEHCEPTNTIRILPYGLAPSQTVHKVGADDYTGQGLAIEWIDVEGPINDTWPPESHRRIFGDLPQKPAPAYNNSERLEVTSQDPAADAERIVRQFVGRAFRRTVTDADVQPFVDIVAAKMAEKHSFEQAVRVGLAAVLVAPEFLFLGEEPGVLDDFALASRLAYFLWSTMPDQELLTLAEAKKLSRPDVLHAQVERLLKDRKSHAFTENFVGQWLGLRDIDFTMPSHILYPEFDEMLKASILRETELFFAEVLAHDLSLTNFVASDFSMLNGRLARHYGIPGVEGWEFRKVPLPSGSHRGGVMTMASVLKVTANGTSTSPVMRGAWVLDRILGTPPPKPPENIAALEPDTRGTTTIREQLAKHRQIASCASCHARIDPAGFALESFDVIGGWRENYRSSGNGKPVVIDGRTMHYLEGPKVDCADVLPDGRVFADIDEFKKLLLADKDQLARSLTVKLVTYATGGAPEKADRGQVEAIVAKVRGQDYGLRSLVHAVVDSELFRNK